MKSKLKEIIDTGDKNPKQGIDRLVTATGITRFFIEGCYSGKLNPNLMEALKIAKALNLRVDQIWQL